MPIKSLRSGPPSPVVAAPVSEIDFFPGTRKSDSSVCCLSFGLLGCAIGLGVAFAFAVPKRFAYAPAGEMSAATLLIGAPLCANVCNLRGSVMPISFCSSCTRRMTSAVEGVCPFLIRSAVAISASISRSRTLYPPGTPAVCPGICAAIDAAGAGMSLSRKGVTLPAIDAGTPGTADADAGGIMLMASSLIKGELWFCMR